jgi:hypothetical protein
MQPSSVSHSWVVKCADEALQIEIKEGKSPTSPPVLQLENRDEKYVLNESENVGDF